MFGKTIVRGLLAVALVASMSAGSAKADAVLPTGLTPGSEYQILFLTSDGTTATSSNIGDYNSFVRQEADQSPQLLALAATWTAVASTSAFNANQASSTTNIPIYDTQGDLLEPNFPSLFTEPNFSGPYYNQFGAYQQPLYPGFDAYGPIVWTGITGLKFSAPTNGGGPLGSEQQLGRNPAVLPNTLSLSVAPV